MNLSQANGTTGYFDFTRVESIEVSTYTTGACPKMRQRVTMTMFSGRKHVWGEYVNNDKIASARRDALLAAVKRACVAEGKPSSKAYARRAR